MLAVFKAGGAYVPIPPDFPVERIVRVLTSAQCWLVLTESTSEVRLRAAITALDVMAGGSGAGGIDVLTIDQRDRASLSGARRDRGEGRVEVAVGAHDLAYVCFTSGSTGEPQGAMCEHAGLLNQLLAKIDELEIGPDSVVAQTSSQFFDISLWQALAPLLVGGRCHIVEQGTILHIERFLDTLADGGIDVVQVVPSYLEAVTGYLAAYPRELPDLSYVCTTGEGMTADLARRWLDVMPRTALVHLYGASETSGETHYETFRRPSDVKPGSNEVSLGRAVPNVRVYVVDDQLTPVPLGAPGMIVVGGPCVGRGYVNEAELGGGRYLEDPYHPGERLYRSGDMGRWLPDGSLEYLGRDDDQVSILGVRVELGEIENALARVPRVEACSVVAAQGRDGAVRLIAFYASTYRLPPRWVRAQLAHILPDFMVPQFVRRCVTLPVGPDGLVDKAALTAMIRTRDTVASADGRGAIGYAEIEWGTPGSVPLTPTEHRLAGVWELLLNTAPGLIGRTDDFFDCGGTSLGAIRLAMALDRTVTAAEIIATPVLGDLAALIDARESVIPADLRRDRPKFAGAG